MNFGRSGLVALLVIMGAASTGCQRADAAAEATPEQTAAESFAAEEKATPGRRDRRSADQRRRSCAARGQGRGARRFSRPGLLLGSRLLGLGRPGGSVQLDCQASGTTVTPSRPTRRRRFATSTSASARAATAWAPGYWLWGGRNYLWYGGRWARPGFGYRFVTPRYGFWGGGWRAHEWGWWHGSRGWDHAHWGDHFDHAHWDGHVGHESSWGHTAAHPTQEHGGDTHAASHNHRRLAHGGLADDAPGLETPGRPTVERRQGSQHGLTGGRDAPGVRAPSSPDQQRERTTGARRTRTPSHDAPVPQRSGVATRAAATRAAADTAADSLSH